jgi:hypothetical protein
MENKKLKKDVFLFYIGTFTTSCGLNLSQNNPRRTPSNSQKILMLNPLAILKPATKSIGAVIASGFAGIVKYAAIMIPE